MNNNKDFKLADDEIKDILKWQGADGCFATDRITVDGCKIGYMYREKPDNDTDSGWRFFAGNEDDEYVNNPKNIGLYKLNTICNYDQSIIPFLNSSYGTAFAKNENGEFIEEQL